MQNPKIILLFSGKRKSGKDFICEQIKNILKEECEIVRISGPLKKLYAKNHQLDFKELMGDGPYKEKYRIDMINWSDEVRSEDPGYFCRAACKDAKITPVWIVSDIRRKTDINWFKENFKNLCVLRIYAETDVRIARGYKYTEGIDNVVSECDLDDFEHWDLQLSNNNSDESKKAVEQIIAITSERIK
ncbi:probable phosphomevalonate kinase [Sitophilus oryzae]|uniref:Phosphomevalonate kinase n=1 Tax=Sitophilus oryzae TaxID=7048 RepID=A0A6J2X526_SITOR|nr:probable phosphomevalonate kinase [Sitophilus oryzae]